MSSPNPWSISSWRNKPIKQQPNYPDTQALSDALDRLKALPPLVFSGEILDLRNQIANAADGNGFVLHGGDCAERFMDCDAQTIVRKLKILLQMSLVLTHAMRKPVVRIGRMAGQFAKPRSSDTETKDGQTLPTYRGDLVNDLEFNETARTPDPNRLLQSYYHAASTLNFVRALLYGGFADLHHPDHWQLKFMANSPEFERFQAIADRITDAIDFFESLGGMQNQTLDRVEFFTSHEGLHLGYEESFTTQPPRRENHFNLGAHFLWIGDRTRQLDGAHIEYFRGIANPIGIKVGPTCSADDLCQLIETLNPNDTPGKLTLITRYGADKVAECLPKHIRAVSKTGRRVLWSSDPMHGNGSKTSTGVKTRDFNAILKELKTAFEIHQSEGGHLGGVHFELTGNDVTECIGGTEGLTEHDLARSYESGCDPRLNYTQSLEMAFLIADMLR
jgi:3-deoxy-7-phosphoheptulonate synthase